MQTQFKSHVFLRQLRRTTLLQAALSFGLLTGAHAYSYDIGANSFVPIKEGKIALATSLQQAQTNTITGTVTDASGAPLPGVTVIEKGTPNAALTDAEGKFSLTVKDPKAVLLFSFLGFEKQEVALNGRATIAVTLGAADNQLKQVEVIATGYGGTTTRGATTGAIDAIRAEEIEDLPLGNLGAALTGRVLGLGVSGGTARPGSQANLTVRAPVSISNSPNTSPLYVIDDMIQVTSQGAPDATFFNTLDPSEIESISILKDASAAMYGSRAANGVIIVTTKRGKLGPPRITYSGSYAVNDEAYRTKMLSAYETGQYINILNGPNGANRPIADNRYFFGEDELEHFRTINHDWLDAAWKPSYNMRHTLNVSGGANKATYFANIAYYTQDGNIGKLDYNKWTFRAGADVNVTAGLKAGLQISGNYQNSHTMNSKIGGENIENDYRNLLRAPRYVPMYMDGLPVRLPGSGNNLSAYHFFEMNNNDNYRDISGQGTMLNIYAEYEMPFLKGLKARGTYARNMTNERSAMIGSQYFLYNFTQTGSRGHIYEGATNPVATRFTNDNRVRFANNTASSNQINFSLSYNQQFGKHSISAFATAERAESESWMEDVWKEDPVLGTNGQFNTAFGAIDGRTNGYESGTLGYIGRVNYNYDGKYLADFLFRSDASTKFAPANYWGKFYSLGTGWVISEENFFRSEAVNLLKIRYSVGLIGKDDTNPWQWRQRYTFQGGKAPVFGDNDPKGTGIKMEVTPNPDAKWTDEFNQNFGIDASFLNSRLSLTLEGFYNRATDMFRSVSSNIPVTEGGTPAARNFAAINTYGTEVSVGWNATIGNDFRYGIDTRFAWYDNKVLKHDFNETDLLYPWRGPRPGESLDIGTWGYDHLGMFRNQEEIAAYVQEYNVTQVFGQPVANLRPGMLYYRDVRGPLQSDGTFAEPDGIIDDNDQIRLLRRASSNYNFGITLKAGYKGFSFDAVLVGSFGGWSEIDGRSAIQGDISNLFQNAPGYWNDIYDPELNPTGSLPNPFHTAISTTPTSAFWRVSAFRIRMGNFNLNYSLPKNVASALHVQGARIVLTSINPINFYNPYTYRNSEGAWDNYPVLRTYSLGINLTL
ncbi:SusC/RagA family TonB-linked outer membrane protein [Pontibacter qinzhouensis]|uniref:SusC/RagA family TonB-linked outer membrane protein n=1 Tax=Pontibacter qinzhouensis TaxID=2603253 RepID=A0A5C8K8U4_9BACT|nr:SusC/RagA family TonB-linked outer membrane protein [Pontibacter qinzhouensis]TXK50267.1 SusC/RagA family TonB-linked outer membrane protein [Pontibacter qinzhouensis]